MSIFSKFKVWLACDNNFKSPFGQIPDNYFDDASDEVVEYLEREGKAFNEDVAKGIKSNKEKSLILLKYLVIGIGGLITILLGRHDQLTKLMIYSFDISIIGWGVAIWYIIRYILWGIPRIGEGCPPDGLYGEFFKNFANTEEAKAGRTQIEILKRSELTNLSRNADQLLTTNNQIASRVRFAVILAIIPTLLSVGVILFTITF